MGSSSAWGYQGLLLGSHFRYASSSSTERFSGIVNFFSLFLGDCLDGSQDSSVINCLSAAFLAGQPLSLDMQNKISLYCKIIIDREPLPD